MLESAEIGHRIEQGSTRARSRKLREALLNAQYDLGAVGRGPVLLIISGVEGGGRGETANQLTEWMDPAPHPRARLRPAHAGGAARPPAWRYWRALPPKGKVGIFMNAWYSETLAQRLRGADRRRRARRAAWRRFAQHERMLTDEGVVLLKFWIHLSKAAQKERLHELDRDTAHPLARDARRLERARALRQVARPVGTRAAGDVHRRGAVVRRRGHRRALPQPDRRQDPARRACSGRSPQKKTRPPRHALTPTGAGGHRQRQADPRPRPRRRRSRREQYERGIERFQGELAKLTRNKRFADASLVAGVRGRRRRAARAARSAASPRRWTRGST